MNLNKQLPLNSLPIGYSGKVLYIEDSELKRRFLDLGIIPGTVVIAERSSPSGDPIAYNIRGALIAIREDDAKNILVHII